MNNHTKSKKTYFDGVMDTITQLRHAVSECATDDIDIDWLLETLNAYEQYHKERLVGL